jgi:NADH-quinone oxidoreductase subunit A
MPDARRCIRLTSRPVDHTGAVLRVPEGYFGQYVTIGIFAVVGVALVFGTLALAKLVSPNVPTYEKYTTYESGIDPIGRGWAQTNVRYYLFALLFVIFDVEAVFLFPWAVVFERLGTQAFVEMVIFIAILAIALLYAVKKKVLEWL